MNAKKVRTPCLICGKEPYRSFYKYCSNNCQQIFQYNLYIREWKTRKKSGLSRIGIVVNPVKKYLRLKFNNKCYLSSWSETNLTTGVVPLIADHIDGNWRNNIESNLRLVCPNCDSLSATNGALNNERGRKK